MFLGYYELEGKEYFYVYYDCKEGWNEWHKDTFSPTCENEKILKLKTTGKTYKQRKGSLIDLAIEWQHDWSSLSWSYGELMDILNWFEVMASRYGLVKEFKENCII